MSGKLWGEISKVSKRIAYNGQVFAMAGHSLNVQPGPNVD